MTDNPQKLGIQENPLVVNAKVHDCLLSHQIFTSLRREDVKQILRHLFLTEITKQKLSVIHSPYSERAEPILRLHLFLFNIFMLFLSK